MTREIRFRTVLPIVESVSAALFGGVGLWQRSAILSRTFLEGQTLWDSTARFHVWPWPYKFAIVSNMPAVFLGSLSSWPIAALWPMLPESVQMALSLLLVPMLWYWVGGRLDKRWTISDMIPWIALLVFTLVCLVGAFAPIGYVGYLPYGFAVWVVTALTVSRQTRVCPGIPVVKVDASNTR
jgi:hypothetical protein